MSDDLLTTRKLAKRWGLKPRTLEKWRALGKGPDFISLGPKCVRYTVEAVGDYERTHEIPPGRKTRLRPRGNGSKLSGE